MSIFLTLAKLLKQPRTLVIVLLGFLLLFLFTLGAHLGINLFWRLVIGGVLLVIGLGFAWLVGRIEKRRQAEKIEQSLVLEAAAAGPDDKARKRKAREEMAAAIARLKASRLADGRSGRDALSVLPWYLVLGASESGKSAMIAHGGLPFPTTGGDPAAACTVGSNCCWWFSNQAVLLEADGRFAADPGRTAAADWDIFLDLLRKQQRDPTLNGVLVAIAADDLVSRDLAWLGERAALLRRRLDSIASNLDLLCPVYLVITRCDMINGFQEFFGDLHGSARDQVWGATYSTNLMNSPVPGDLFQQEFDLLLRSLDRRRLPRLIRTEQDRTTQQQAFLFPLEFYKLRDKLRAFAEALFASSSYAHQPPWRGFYFTTAGGGGAKPAETVLADVSQVIGLPGFSGYTPPPQPAQMHGPQGEPRFLKTLFMNVLIPDQGLVRLTARALRRRHSWRLVLRGAACLALPLLLTLSTISLIRNLQLVRESKALSERVMDLKLEAGLPQEITRTLTELDPLRNRLERIDAWQERRPLTLDLGLYRGDRVGRHLRRIYLEHLRDVLLRPSHERLLEKLLRENPRDHDAFDRFFDGYQTYRMLTRPRNGDPELVARELRSLWFSPDDASESTDRQLQRIEDHVIFAWRHSGELGDACKDLPVPDPVLKARADGFIKQFWSSDSYYKKQLRDVNELAQAQPFSRESKPVFRTLLAGPGDGRDGADAVPYAFTHSGWQHMLSRIKGSVKELENNWLLQDALDEQARDIRGELLRMYLGGHHRHWVDYLGTIDLLQPAPLPDAYKALDTWARHGSVLFVFLKEMRDAMDLGGDIQGLDAIDVEAIERAQGDYRAIREFFRPQGSGDQTFQPDAAYLEALGKLASFLDPLVKANGKAAVAENVREVFKRQGKGSTALEEVYNGVPKFIISGGDRRFDLALEAFLRRPAIVAWRACLRATEEHLNDQWDEHVWGVYGERLNRYPLHPGASGDVSMPDFTAFFRPAGTLEAFVKKELDGFLTADWKPASVLDGSLKLSPDATKAFAKSETIRRVLFSDNAAEPAVGFELTPQQPYYESGQGDNPQYTRLRLGSEDQLMHDITGLPVARSFRGPVERFSGNANLSLEPEQFFLAFRIQKGGDWALFRLVEEADMDRLGNNRFRVTWLLKDGAKQIKVPYELKTDPDRNPFVRDFFTFSCPRRLFP